MKTPNKIFVSRFFAPAAGVNEDPVTGSAHCCLADYWGNKLNKQTLTGYQASKRGGVVGMRLDGGAYGYLAKRSCFLRASFES